MNAAEIDRLERLFVWNRDSQLCCEAVGRHQSAAWFAREAESYRDQAEQCKRLAAAEGAAA